MTWAILASPARAADEKHLGPAGLEWGKSPPTAKSILGKRFRFVSEKKSDDYPYHTIEQRYEGEFAGLPVEEIELRFHKGEFFYMAVEYPVEQLGDATRAWDNVVEKMSSVYGQPDHVTRPSTLFSKDADLAKFPFRGPQKRLWQWVGGAAEGPSETEAEPTSAEDLGEFQWKDLQVKTRMWEPLARWEFTNQVMVQTFVHSTLPDQPTRTSLRTRWIFVNHQRFDHWEQKSLDALHEKPRDY